jgi:ABC-2 type transport system ATP-binding protein
MHVIDMNGLGKVYRGKKGARVEALQSLSLQIAQGEVFGFLGPNGAGKSTTIKILMGLILQTEGSANIMGVDVSESEARRYVGYLPENPSFFDFLSAEEYLRFVGKSFGMQADLIQQKSEEVLRLLDLWDARKRQVRGYSKGMVQRLGLAQTLIHDPQVYILDEPMSGLDPIGRALVKDIIRELRLRGKTVFFSTHITADVEAVCDRVSVINKGRLQVTDHVAAILNRGVEGYAVQLAYSDGRCEEVVVAQDVLQSFIESAVSKGIAIERIEPQRKDMEAFFLEIVAAQ